MTSVRATLMMAIAASIAALSLAFASAPATEQASVPAAEPPLDVVWNVPLDSPNVSGVAATNSTVFVTTSGATLAYAAADGTLLWKQTPGSDVSPAISGDTVAVITPAAVHVLGSDGAQKWQASFAGVSHAAAAGSDLILVGGRTVARWSSGKELWRLELNGEAATAPLIHAGALFVGIKPAGVDVIDPDKGHILAFLHLPAGPDALGTAPERLMVCTSDGNSAGWLSSYTTLRPRGLDWTWDLVRCIGAPESDAERTYAAFMDNTVRAFDTDSGHQRWTGRLPTRPRSGPIRFPNSIVVPLATGLLAEFTLEGKAVGTGKRPAGLPNLLRMLSVTASPGRTHVFTTGATSELGSRLLFAWARPSPKKPN